MKAEFCPYLLRFREPATTSRAVMLVKETFFLRVADPVRHPGAWGLGECALFRGLSADDTPDFADRLAALCADIARHGPLATVPADSSALRFGLETALADLRNGAALTPWPGPWPRGQAEIPINGLVWMGPRDAMARRIAEKLDAGFRCIKLKIGALDFADELALIQALRDRFSPALLELRLDANGAFDPADALHRLRELAPFAIHSIEQPIRAGQPEAMAEICARSPIPIALDEELIGCRPAADKRRLLRTIRPQYIVLKPSLCGGFADADEWAAIADDLAIGWWATSALESDIGLNAIAQWRAAHPHPIDRPQGLGTGRLFTNNIPSPLRLHRQALRADPALPWALPPLPWRSP